MKEKELQTRWLSTDEELGRREKFFQTFRNCPMPDHELLQNLGLFMNGPALARLLFMNDLYQKIVNVHGSVMEFGVRWGQNLALWSNFRALYEPYNHNRKIIGFDTWEGFPSVHEKDLAYAGFAPVGGYAVTSGYENYLTEVLDFHEQDNPVPHLKKYELRKGDAVAELEKYLTENPHTIVSLAYFDFDIYEPTKVCLELIKPYLTKGSVIGFDELNRYDFPGETIALREVFGLDKYRIMRSPYSRVNSYLVIE